MYRIKVTFTDDSSFERSFGVYTEAIVALCAAINAAQIDGHYKSAYMEKEIVE